MLTAMKPVNLSRVEKNLGVKLDKSDALYGALTDREKEVAELIADGMKMAKIAEQLKISPKTLDIHRANCFRKLETKSIATLTKIVVIRRFFE